MNELMLSEKERLTEKLSNHFARNVITLDEYEKMLDVVNKIETSRDIIVAEKMINTYSDMVTPQPPPRSAESSKKSGKKRKKKEYVSIFSWREVKIAPVDGKAGTFTSIFGTMQVKIGDLPAGETDLEVEAIFGLVEILVPKNVRIISKVDAIFGGAYIPEDEQNNDYSPELIIKGEAIFGNVTVKRID